MQKRHQNRSKSHKLPVKSFKLIHSCQLNMNKRDLFIIT
jgi:hypothetical protein